MITTSPEKPPIIQENPPRRELDFAQLRRHARQLQQDLELIRADLASMKAKFGPEDNLATPAQSK